MSYKISYQAMFNFNQFILCQSKKNKNKKINKIKNCRSVRHNLRENQQHHFMRSLNLEGEFNLEGVVVILLPVRFYGLWSLHLQVQFNVFTRVKPGSALN